MVYGRYIELFMGFTKQQTWLLILVEKLLPKRFYDGIWCEIWMRHHMIFRFNTSCFPKVVTQGRSPHWFLTQFQHQMDRQRCGFSTWSKRWREGKWCWRFSRHQAPSIKFRHFVKLSSFNLMMITNDHTLFEKDYPLVNVAMENHHS